MAKVIEWWYGEEKARERRIRYTLENECERRQRAHTRQICPIILPYTNTPFHTQAVNRSRDADIISGDPPPRIKYVHFFFIYSVRFHFTIKSTDFQLIVVVTHNTAQRSGTNHTLFFPRYFLLIIILGFFFRGVQFSCLLSFLFSLLVNPTSSMFFVIDNNNKIIAIIYNYGVFVVFPVVGLFWVCSCGWLGVCMRFFWVLKCNLSTVFIVNRNEPLRDEKNKIHWVFLYLQSRTANIIQQQQRKKVR